MAFRKVCFGTTTLTCLLIVIANLYLRQPPAADLLAANSNHQAAPMSRALLQLRRKWEETNNFGKVTMTAAQASALMWGLWVEENQHVEIGSFYNTCDADDRLTLGKMIMVPDTKKGGVKAGIHLNLTYDHDVEGGKVNFEAFYKGQELLATYWDLCKELDDINIHCPIPKGPFQLAHEIKISPFLPRGNYRVNADVRDQSNRVIYCVICDFTL